MDVKTLTLDARRLWPGEAMWDAPLCLIDLDAVEDAPSEPQLPACPVIGFGDLDHPFARHLDALIEAPASLEGVVRQVLARPLAAAVVVQLLRILPGLAPEAGLTAESLAYGVLQGSSEHREWLAARKPVGVELPPGRVTLERSGDALTVTLDREASGNSVDRFMRDALHEAFTLASVDPDIRQVSLRGAGRTFSLGAVPAARTDDGYPAGSWRLRFSGPADRAAEDRAADPFGQAVVNESGTQLGAGRCHRG